MQIIAHTDICDDTGYPQDSILGNRSYSAELLKFNQLALYDSTKFLDVIVVPGIDTKNDHSIVGITHLYNIAFNTRIDYQKPTISSATGGNFQLH